MTTLLTIPAVKALHVASPGVAPLPLSSGDLTLVVIPANPPTHPSETITLSVGSSSFPLLPNSPLQRVKAKDEHPSYLFSPVAADGGAGIGQVLIQMKGSTNQGEWEATEAMCRKLEETLKSRHLWDEKIKFVNDEYDTAGEPVKGWGETVAGAVTGGASFIAEKIAGLTESHVGSTPPNRHAAPSYETAGKAAALRNSTAHFAENAHAVGANVGAKVNEVGRDIAGELPPDVQKLGEPTPEHLKSDVRKVAEEGWEQVTIAAKGIANAAGLVGTSVSENTHRAIAHNFGSETDRVAQDVGQATVNLGSSTLAVGTAANVAVKGVDGASETRQGKV